MIYMRLDLFKHIYRTLDQNLRKVTNLMTVLLVRHLLETVISSQEQQRAHLKTILELTICDRSSSCEGHDGDNV